MKLLCKYYNNQARLENSMQFLSSQPSFRFFCISGMIVKNRKSFSVLTEHVTVVTACILPNTGKNSMLLMTSDPALKEEDGKEVDTLTLECNPIFYDLCVLLQEKFKIVGNPVTVEFRGDQMVVAVTISSVENGEFQCTVRGTEGDLVIRGSQNICDMLRHCRTFHCFKYSVDNTDCQREVSVKRGKTEILREVARYLNRTLVLVSFLPEGDMLEQYVSTSGLLEVVTKGDGTRIYRKLLGTKLREADSFCVYQTVAKVDDILREQGRALHTDRRSG